MKCPKCKHIDLNPVRLEEALVASGCSQCHGAFVSLLHYRDWAERTAALHEVPEVKLLKEFDNEDSSGALCCPKCQRLMSKFRISGCSANRLDLCSSCDEAWLDGGEWELLKALELTREMPVVFTQHWQNKVRKEVSEAARRERYSKILNNSDLARADEFREWLKVHPQRNEIMFYVGHD